MAADQVEIVLPKTKFFEESAFTATAYFRTRATMLATAPTTVHYRIDDLKTKKELADWTSVSAAASVSIAITPTHNEIQDDSSRLERRQLTVQADRGLATQVNGVALWQVRNLQGIT